MSDLIARCAAFGWTLRPDGKGYELLGNGAPAAFRSTESLVAWLDRQSPPKARMQLDTITTGDARAALTLELADDAGRRWAQAQWTAHHYLRRPIDSRCSVLAYLVRSAGQLVGALGFGRPESTRCYDGALTYGSQADVTSGRARFDRWELINLARVWLDPRIQQGGAWYVPNAATWAIGQALKRVVADYLLAYPPCFLDEPWRLTTCLSYCDTRLHKGTIYRAAGFELARTNADGIETWYRPLRGLQGAERKAIEHRAEQSPRSRRYRAQRAALGTQAAFVL